MKNFQLNTGFVLTLAKANLLLGVLSDIWNGYYVGTDDGKGIKVIEQLKYLAEGDKDIPNEILRLCSLDVLFKNGKFNGSKEFVSSAIIITPQGCLLINSLEEIGKVIDPSPQLHNVLSHG